MGNFTANLLDLTANDLMSRDLMVLPQDMSIRQAAHLLSQAHVSGAPVVDTEGRCVGVISGTDFLHWVEREGCRSPRRHEAASPVNAWQVMDVETLPSEQVRDVMTANPVLVGLFTTIGRLAQQMLDAHIHRVVVVNAEDRPIGIVSSTDVLAAVAWAARTREHVAPPTKMV